LLFGLTLFNFLRFLSLSFFLSLSLLTAGAGAAAVVLEDPVERKKRLSKWFHRITMLLSLIISVVLTLVSIYGFWLVGDDKFGLGKQFVFFQIVFAFIGM
jgi:ABC-type multidrug transport system fused ATPase/permease subunit